MCGIVAAISKGQNGFGYKDDAVFSQLLYANALRGFDSTGLYGVKMNGNLDMIKEASPAAQFMQDREAQNFIKDIYHKYRIVVGHNRAATKGAVKDENAHPFIEDHICLVHNGTLFGHRRLANVDVDSHAITHALAKDDFREVIPSLDGAFALIWYDAKEKKLHITRNKERPLWVITSPTVDFIASEPKMLEWICERNGLKNAEAKYFQENTAYTYDLENLKDGFYTEDLPEKKPKPAAQVSPVRLVKSDHSHKTRGATGKEGVAKKGKPFWKDYYYGQKVAVRIHSQQSFEESKNTIFRGCTVEGDQDPWQFVVATDSVPSLGNRHGVYIGVVSGVTTKNKVTSLFLNDIKEEECYVSCNDELVTDEELLAHGGYCDCCGEMVDPGKENFWVRYRPGRIKMLKCETCTLEDKNLSHYLTKGKQNVH